MPAEVGSGRNLLLHFFLLKSLLMLETYGVILGIKYGSNV